MNQKDTKFVAEGVYLFNLHPFTIEIWKVTAATDQAYIELI